MMEIDEGEDSDANEFRIARGKFYPDLEHETEFLIGKQAFHRQKRSSNAKRRKETRTYGGKRRRFGPSGVFKGNVQADDTFTQDAPSDDENPD